MDFDFSDVERDVIDTARGFAATRVKHRAREIDEQNRFPADLVA